MYILVKINLKTIDVSNTSRVNIGLFQIYFLLNITGANKKSLTFHRTWIGPIV